MKPQRKDYETEGGYEAALDTLATAKELPGREPSWMIRAFWHRMKWVLVATAVPALAAIFGGLVFMADTSCGSFLVGCDDTANVALLMLVVGLSLTPLVFLGGLILVLVRWVIEK